MNNTVVIPAVFSDTLTYTMTYVGPRIISLHDSAGNMFVAHRLINTGQINNCFLHGLEPWIGKNTGLDVLECYFLKQQQNAFDDADMQKYLDLMDNFSFTLSKVKATTHAPFDLVDLRFDMKWTVNGNPESCVLQLPFVCISKAQFECPTNVAKPPTKILPVHPKKLAVLIYRSERVHHGRVQILDGVLEPGECEFLGLAEPVGQNGSYKTETDRGKWLQTDTLAGPRPLQELIKRALSIGFEFKTKEQRDAADGLCEFEMVRFNWR